MVKKRLCIVLSPPISARVGLCTVVPLSMSQPDPVQPYHYELDIPFQLPSRWGNTKRWVKGDMICAVGWHRIDLLLMGKDRYGKREYQLSTLSISHLAAISDCVLSSLGLSPLTK